MDEPILVGVPGRILAGSEAGRYVKVVDDRDLSRGFLLLTADDIEFTTRVFDNWLADDDDVALYFSEAGYEVEWLNRE
jgi:hypothetical protein